MFGLPIFFLLLTALQAHGHHQASASPATLPASSSGLQGPTGGYGQTPPILQPCVPSRRHQCHIRQHQCQCHQKCRQCRCHQCQCHQFQCHQCRCSQCQRHRGSLSGDNNALNGDFSSLHWGIRSGGMCASSLSSGFAIMQFRDQGASPSMGFAPKKFRRQGAPPSIIFSVAQPVKSLQSASDAESSRSFKARPGASAVQLLPGA